MKKAPPVRSIVVELPEDQLMKFVRLAKGEGVSTRELVSRKLLDVAKGIER
ncbi:ribbon-helix-helix DNA binding domain protein [Gordonia phage Banquo]|nr:ribbon-helix-helix DNA binding domain protein [Gordonia phage Banquo]